MIRKKKPDIKEEITDITSLRKEFDNFESLISQQIGPLFTNVWYWWW